MLVRDLAKEMGVTEAILELLDKKHPNNAVSDEEVEKVLEVLGDGTTSVAEKPAPKKQEKRTDVLRFWSNIRNFSFPVMHQGEQKLARFENYCMLAVENGPAHKAIMGLRDPAVKLVVDEPFEDIGQISQFRKMLEGQLKTGLNDEISFDRGMTYVMALFDHTEQEKAAKAFSKYGADGLIEVAVRMKSYIEQPYKG